jgi:hypothetical protein
MVGQVTLNGPGDRCFWSWWPFFAASFRETQNPDSLDTFDFDKLTFKLITLARKHQTIQIFCKKVDNSNVQFRLKFQINRLRNKKVMP